MEDKTLKCSIVNRMNLSMLKNNIIGRLFNCIQFLATLYYKKKKKEGEFIFKKEKNIYDIFGNTSWPMLKMLFFITFFMISCFSMIIYPKI